MVNTLTPNSFPREPEYLYDQKVNFGDIVKSLHNPNKQMVVTGVRADGESVFVDAAAITENPETGERKLGIPGSMNMDDILEVTGKMSFDEICEGLARTARNPEDVEKWTEEFGEMYKHYAPNSETEES